MCMNEGHRKIKESIIAWAQYVHWADINIERFLELNDDVADSIKIAISAQWLASEYVALEGWINLNEKCFKIEEIINRNPEWVDIMRRYRNAVYHFQKKPLDKRLLLFNKDPARIFWAAELHKAFLQYLIDYPNKIYPIEHRKEEFIQMYYSLIGWTPNIIKST